MDAFYASVEQRDDPRLRGKPVIVGGHPTRGVVLAASYEARPLGIRSAMPMSRAVKLAPRALVVPPRFEAYAAASEAVFELFEALTPLVEPLSLDEAFLDVTASQALFGSPWEMATRLRARIAEQVQLPASAGIAPVKFAAKIASDLAKPNGQHEVLPGELEDFLHPLPVTRLWGVGPKTAETLQGLGLRTVGDVAARPRGWLEQKLGESGGHLWALSHGLDDRAVIPDREAKSLGAEDTFEEDVSDGETLRLALHGQALRVARRMRRVGARTRVVQLKLKFHDFSVITRRCTLQQPTDDGQALYRSALKLLEPAWDGRPVRLTGVSAQGLGAPAPQLSLFEPGPGPRDRLNRALDKIADKFGSAAVVTADLAGTAADADDDEDRDRARRELGASRSPPGQGGR
jgi:DNA polymerase-4